MAIEFRCSQCNQLLRVSDASAGKNARCPKCQTLMTVPAAGGTASGDPFSPLSTASASADAPSSFQPAAAQSQDPFAFLGPGAAGGLGGSSPPPMPPPKPAGNPFGDAQGGSPFGSAAGSVNPYAAPTGGYEPTVFAPANLPVTNVRVPFDPIWNHAFRVWQANLGLLVGTTFIAGALSFAAVAPFAIGNFVLEQNREPELAAIVNFIGDIVSGVVQLYLGIGLAQIALKLARGFPAEVSDVFKGGPRFLPVLGVSLLFGLAVGAGTMLCIVPGVLVALWFWPCYYLVLEQKAGVIESFSLASRVTEGNRATSFVLGLASFGISILGCCAFYFGLLFAAPLVSLMSATAYLMMSGQLQSQPQYGKY